MFGHVSPEGRPGQADDRAGAVAAALLRDDVPSATLEVMLAVPLPLATATKRQQLAYMGSLVAIALGSPEFQRR
jgi:hypothetical protein